MAGRSRRTPARPSLVFIPLLLSFAAWVSTVGCSSAHNEEFARIPGGIVHLGSRATPDDNPPRSVRLAAFLLGVHEVTVRDYARYLNESAQTPDGGSHPDLILNDNRWNPAPDRGRWPVAHITRRDAEDYCRWYSTVIGRTVRLPTEDEWEAAARGGLSGARWPWGHGPPDGRIAFNLKARVQVGRYEPNPHGLFDMAGNVFEWCAGPDPGDIPARGGAWSEVSADDCAVFQRHVFRSDYRGADVGFRIAVDP